jgi:hypothetical protein
LLEIDRGEVDAEWLKKTYEKTQTGRIRNHIRFADYWYSVNGHFTELKEYCAEIAAAAGVTLEPAQAFVWMGSGGFANDEVGLPAAGTFTIASVKYNIRSMTGKSPKWEVEKYNRFRLNLDGAIEEVVATYSRGRVHQVNCLRRGTFLLADCNVYGAMLAALRAERELEKILDRYFFETRKRGLKLGYEATVRTGVDVLEAMLVEGWVEGEVATSGKYLGLASAYPQQHFHIGWIEDGVGLTSVNPQTRGKTMLPWKELLALRES